jgi:site-specific DNA-methyltransferase (adenine-specific)
MTPYYQDDACTLYHGDCREVLPGLPKVDLVLTDPPFDEKTHNGARTGSDGDQILLTFQAMTACEIIGAFGLCRAICAKWFVAFLDWHHLLPLEQQQEIDLELVRFGIWVKPNNMPQYSGDRPATGWEAIAFLHRKGKKVWNGRGRTSVFVHNFEQVDRTHPTQKPIGLICELTNLFSNEGEIVLDPFAGSGTTLRAAKDLGRRAIGIEIEERYCEIAARRLEQGVFQFT